MYRLKSCGKLSKKSADQVAFSRLGIGFEKLDRDTFDPNKAYDMLQKIGVKWVRIQSGWQKTEQKKGEYDFSWLDSIVDNLIARGLRPWMCVCYGNKLYGGMAEEVFGAVGCPPIHTEEQKEAWRSYCTALAAHYVGRVDHFEIWNEPDGIWCWKHGVSATELGNFTVDTAKALKVGNPESYIIGGAVNEVRVQYLNEAFATGMADNVDAISFHAYTFNDLKIKDYIKGLRAIINKYNPALEIIQGESGAQSRPFGNGALNEGAWTPRKQCKLLLRHLITDLGMNVKFASYFSCMDMIEALCGKVGDKSTYLDYGYFGVLSAEFDENGVASGEYTPKPSYYALQSLASLFAGETSCAELPITVEDDITPNYGRIPSVGFADVESYGFRLANGSYAFAYWHPSNYMTTDFESAVTLSTALGENIHLVDPMDGTVYDIPESMIVKDGFGGALLKLIPIRDYPLILVFGGID